jgi:hypothetical protein
VGSTTKSDVVSSFSNSASFLSLLAPGESITSSVPGGAFAVESGTSAAAPHVAGAWAILKQAKPAATVSQILTALTSTGVPITDPKNGLTKPRIRVNLALQNLVVTGVSLTPTPPSPQPAGTSITWTAVTTGGTAPQFRFWILPQGGAFSLAQDYSLSNTFPWTPSATGDYTICVWAKSSGSSADKEADACQGFLVTPGIPVTSVALSSNPPSPQPVGTPVTWTAVATGGTAPQFRFWVQPQGGPFTLAQDYSASNTLTRTPSAAGNFVICVWAKSSGSSAAKEADDCKPFQVTPPPPSPV